MGYLDGSGLSYLWRKIRSAIGAQATPRNLLDNTGFEFLSTPDATRHALFDIPDCERVLDLILNEDA